MRRHELDPVSLTFGFIYAGLGLLFLIGRADQALRLHWIWPLLLIVLGVGILVDVARHRDRATPTPDAEDVPGPDPDPATVELGADSAGGAVDNREQPS